MPNCSADKASITIRGVSETPPGWSSICNLGQCSGLEHSMQSRRRHAMATKGAQSNRTRAQLVIIIDVGSHCKVVCKSDAQDRDVLDFFKALYNGWW